MLLIETAAEALGILSDEAPSDMDTDQFVRNRAMSFRELASRYFSLVNASKYICSAFHCIDIFIGYPIRFKKPYALLNKRSKHHIFSKQNYTL